MTINELITVLRRLKVGAGTIALVLTSIIVKVDGGGRA